MKFDRFCSGGHGKNNKPAHVGQLWLVIILKIRDGLTFLPNRPNFEDVRGANLTAGAVKG
jgi:hypothetical protein